MHKVWPTSLGHPLLCLGFYLGIAWIRNILSLDQIHFDNFFFTSQKIQETKRQNLARMVSLSLFSLGRAGSKTCTCYHSVPARSLQREVASYLIGPRPGSHHLVWGRMVGWQGGAAILNESSASKSGQPFPKQGIWRQDRNGVQGSHLLTDLDKKFMRDPELFNPWWKCQKAGSHSACCITLHDNDKCDLWQF